MVAASREFVCVRPQTYEDRDESEMLSYVYAGRTGLQNTSFALLDPNGKKLTRGSRSPAKTYGTAEKFAAALNEMAAKYKAKARPLEGLPTVRDLRLALNVAAADMRPLIVVCAKGEREANKLAASVAGYAWSKNGMGRAHYVVLAEGEEFEGLVPELGVSVIQPDPFGLGGKVLSHVRASAKAKDLHASLASAVGKHEVAAREHKDHVREARRKGITWESEVEVTDFASNSKSRRGGDQSK